VQLGGEWSVPVRRIAEHKAAALSQSVDAVMLEFRANPSLVEVWARTMMTWQQSRRMAFFENQRVSDHTASYSTAPMQLREADP
jgi:hypothetical protein